MEKRFISDLKANEKIDTFFIVRKKNLKLTKYDKPYLELSFQDKSGSIEGRLWDNAEKFSQAFETGDVARVKGGKYYIKDAAEELWSSTGPGESAAGI